MIVHEQNFKIWMNQTTRFEVLGFSALYTDLGREIWNSLHFFFIFIFLCVFLFCVWVCWEDKLIVQKCNFQGRPINYILLLLSAFQVEYFTDSKFINLFDDVQMNSCILFDKENHMIQQFIVIYKNFVINILYLRHFYLTLRK